VPPTERVPPLDEPPLEEPPVDEPPLEEPPVDEPPLEEPPVDEASLEEPPVDGAPPASASASLPPEPSLFGFFSSSSHAATNVRQNPVMATNRPANLNIPTILSGAVAPEPLYAQIEG
jgi:hypothetical protein